MNLIVFKYKKFEIILITAVFSISEINFVTCEYL